jgi:hypothetical protein
LTGGRLNQGVYFHCITVVPAATGADVALRAQQSIR